MRPVLLCIQRVAPRTALAAEASAADWMRDTCPTGVYATLTTTRQRAMLHRLTARCATLAKAYRSFAGARAKGADAELGHAFAQSLRVALAREAGLRFVAGDELHVTLHASPADEALRAYVQPAPPRPAGATEAALSRPLVQAAAEVRGDLLRTGGWATPQIHPSLAPCAAAGACSEETLLHEAATDRVIEGLTSSLFVVGADGALRTASAAEGAYMGSTRAAVLRLATASALFSDVRERAPTGATLRSGEWQEAWLACSNRRVAPLARIWHASAD
jgi:branched-subunit amino acid aminotransferase/4-amino-4-deoxychorismate lyase